MAESCVQDEPTTVGSEMFACKYCCRTYKSKGGLSKHVKLHHRENYDQEKSAKGGTIPCGQCQSMFPTLSSLIQHQIDAHNSVARESRIKFPTLHSFLEWKTSKELESNTKYVQHCAVQTSSTTNRWYYYCNRGGQYTPKGKGQRSLKMQGTSKIGHACTAHMRVIQDISSGTVSVTYHDSHNHTIQLGHIPLPENTRLVVAQKLREGVTFEKILDYIREDVVNDSISRQHLLTRQDINNIKRQFNIEGIERHKDDHMSVCAWVEELSALEANPIVVFKPQGSDNHTLPKDDFLIGIQTSFQCDMMRNFGEKLICMDATHGTNHYDFKLVTILVLDDFGEGVPVAWMISNKEDGTTLKEFLRSLLLKTGPLQTMYFMSDDAEQYFSAWKGIYGGDPRKLLCTWHVDRAWRKNLQAIKSVDKKADVYCCLRSILQTLSISEFRKLMQQFVTWMLSDTQLQSFREYFQTYYAKRTEQWAYCYRVGTPVNTNMSVESFHRLLKVVYLESKHNRRIDHLLSILLRIARDKLFERIIKSEKGKVTHRIGEINRRHRGALDLLQGTVTLEQESVCRWHISSSSQSSKMYLVKRNLDDCNCNVRCSTCDVCVHMYTCSCVDNAIHNTACKHIHVVHMKFKPTLPSTTTASQDDHVGPNQDHMMEVTFSQYHQQSAPSEVEQLDQLKREFQQLVSQASLLASETSDQDVLKAGIQHIRNAVSVMKSVQNTSGNKQLIPAKSIAPNTNIQCQTRFHSTKRKRVAEDYQGLSKPTATQVNACVSSLTIQHVQVCGVCFKEEDMQDRNEPDKPIDWVQCTNCGVWLHTACVLASMQLQSIADSNCFVCSYCEQDIQSLST